MGRADLSGVDIGVSDAQRSPFSKQQAPGPGTDGIPVRIVDVGEAVAISDDAGDVVELGAEGKAAAPDHREGGLFPAWGVGAIALAILAGGAVMLRRLRR